MDNFSLKPDIKFGEDSLDFLKTQKFKRYFIVTDKVMVSLKFVDKIIEKLGSNICVKIFSDVTPNPTVESVEKAVKEMLVFNPECIIALGGGSPIDACKAMLYFGDKVKDELKENSEKIKFIAIPTTSGTGSEVTSYSVLTAGDKKIALSNDSMLPDIALLNPLFMETLPKKVIADTGIDVLTHSLEAYVSKKSNPFTNSMAIEAIKLVYKYLVPHYNDSKILIPRENIQYASCLAGIAFNNSSLGINHSIAHTLGAKLHISHGRANGIVMPYVIDVNTNAYNLYSKIAEELKLPASSVEEGKKSFKIYVEILKEKLEIPKCLKDLGIPFEEYKSLIPEFICDIKNDICTEYSPNTLSDEEYIKLLLKIYFGE